MESIRVYLTPATIAGAAAVTGAGAMMAFGTLLHLLHRSLGLEPPTPRQLEEEDPDKCALFRHLPALRERIAWRAIGSGAPTPIHRATVSCIPTVRPRSHSPSS